MGDVDIYRSEYDHCGISKLWLFLTISHCHSYIYLPCTIEPFLNLKLPHTFSLSLSKCSLLLRSSFNKTIFYWSYCLHLSNASWSAVSYAPLDRVSLFKLGLTIIFWTLDEVGASLFYYKLGGKGRRRCYLCPLRSEFCPSKDSKSSISLFVPCSTCPVCWMGRTYFGIVLSVDTYFFPSKVYLTTRACPKVCCGTTGVFKHYAMLFGAKN